MKRSILFLVSALAAAAALTSCQEEYVPDGVVGFDSITLTSALNSSLSADVNGVIEGKTITFAIPESVTATSFIPTFKVTTDDILTVGGKTVESGVTSVEITNGKQFKLEDDKSGLSETYTIAVVGDDEKAELLSVTIAAADNASLLNEDVTAEIADQMVVRVPGTAFRQELTLTLAASSNDVITVNKQATTDGKAINVDTAFPIDIEVTDNVNGKSASYVLKVGKILEMVATSAGTYTNSDVQPNLAMAMDDKNGVPYLVINENSTVDGVTTKDLMTVLKSDGNALSVVGEAKFSGCQTAYNVIDVYDGTPYVFFQDYQDNSTSKKYQHSVMAFKGASWEYVGKRGFSERSTMLYGKYPFALGFEPVSGNIITVCTSNAANTNGVAKRGASVSVYNGSSWSANMPINGRSQVMAYTPRLCRTSDAAYLLVCNQTEKSFSLYKYASGSWSTVIADFWPKSAEGANQTEIGTTFLAMKANAKNEVYAAMADNTSGDWILSIYTLDEANKTFKKFGNSIPGASFGDTGCVFDIAFDADGNPVVAYKANEENAHIKVVSVDPETKDWTAAFDFGEVANDYYLGIGNTKDGLIYVAYSVQDESKVNTIKVFKYMKEEDILPE